MEILYNTLYVRLWVSVYFLVTFNCRKICLEVHLIISWNNNSLGLFNGCFGNLWSLLNLTGVYNVTVYIYILCVLYTSMLFYLINKYKIGMKHLQQFSCKYTLALKSSLQGNIYINVQFYIQQICLFCCAYLLVFL